MRDFHKTGDNVLHLIYPIRQDEGKTPIPDLLKQKGWLELLSGKNTSKDSNHSNEEDVQSVAHTALFSTESPPPPFLISEEQIISYFHPSVQNVLFHSNKSFNIFHKETAQKRYQGHFSESEKATFEFEWLSSEIYTFSGNTAFFVARLSFLAGEQSNLSTWMKFVNRIRQNYKKFKEQPTVLINHLEEGEPTNAQPRLFIDIVKQFLSNHLSEDLQISNVTQDEYATNLNERYLIEPNAFVHAYVSGDFSAGFSDDELYQFIHIDEYNGESGGTEAFKQSFLEQNVYRRWENKGSYYTAIDYGTITAINGPNPVLHQHHCRLYLLFIILQLYYREELQELVGSYARLDFSEETKAEKILKNYYNLNQHFIFNRVSNEIQGRELWKFYYNAFEISELYQTVYQDIQELNERNKEIHAEKQKAHAEKQEKQLKYLTIISAIGGLLGMNLIIPVFESYVPSFGLPFEWRRNLLEWVGIASNIIVILVIPLIIVYIVILLFKNNKTKK